MLLVLIIMLVVLAVITIVGHLTWLMVAAIVRWVLGAGNDATTTSISFPWRCVSCSYEMAAAAPYCSNCGSRRPSAFLIEQLKELAATERQIVRFCSDGKLDDATYELLISQIRAERTRLVSRKGMGERPAAEPAASILEKKPTPATEPVKTPGTYVTHPSVVAPSGIEIADVVFEPVPSFISNEEAVSSQATARQAPPERFMPPPRPPRKPFTEVLTSFMEESNIRWGEIIGGLLIIGCSTALVVSLWSQISQIPVLKFLIFTTVTAVLFGIGLYTEHRWKLPTTSRGILTIATLLVPLNFLAIAAVSASDTSGALVIGSELVAPAIFLCLVYFAGRVITPGCAHVLSAGVLGSSVGQLLVRHFASSDSSPVLLILLGAFPVVCYIVTVGFALRVVLADREIDESETTTVFTVLGTMSFAALLPFGLLLYKSGPLSWTMMYLAPLITLWGLPMLATGTVLWRRIRNQELVASRTAGTALGILGIVVVLAGMILAWPNPASIVPAALINFAIFTALAVALELPVAHLIAAFCFGLAYLVVYHVSAGHITWENLRVMSLLEVSLSISSGQALIGAFGLFLTASEWLSRKDRDRDAYYYLVAACVIGTLSLALATSFGLWSLEYHSLWIVYGIYTLGAFWIAWRLGLTPFTWIGSALLLFSLADGFAHPLSFLFPWQIALLTHATICAAAAIVSSNYARGKVLERPLNYGALISLVLGVVSLFQANTWEITAMQAQRVFWIAGILLLLLWLNRRRILFSAFQITLTTAVVLTIKAALQQYEWYSYLPHAFLHPSALQIQGSVLVLLGLVWLSLRIAARRALRNTEDENNWLVAAWRLLDSRYSIDRIVSWSLLGAFLLLAVYGSLSGVTQELAAWGSGYPGFNVAGFPHQEALALGSWIVLGLLTLTMLANFWERRRGAYLLGALAALSAGIPLIAGRFENQVATATSWRWLAALFLLSGSLVLWYRRAIYSWLSSAGWPQLNTSEEELPRKVRTLLIVLTVAPLLVLTVYPALRSIYYLPVQGPTSGFFRLFDDDFSYGAPLIMVALVMIGYAVRERMPQFGVYAGFLFNATVTLAFLLAVVAANGSMDRVVLVRLAQLNAITSAVYSLPWLSTRRRWQPALDRKQKQLADDLLKLQVGIAIALNAVLLVPVAIDLIFVPQPAGIGAIAAGTLPGWLAFGATVVAAAWLARGRQRFSAGSLAAMLLGASCLAAFSVSDISGWVGLHTLTVCMAGTAWSLLAAGGLNSRKADRSTSLPLPLKLTQTVFNLSGNWQSSCRRFAAMAGGVAVFLALRTALDVEMSRWWSIGPLLALSVLATTLNWQTLRRGYLYAAGLLFNVAVSLWWIFVATDIRYISNFVFTNLIAACLASILWLCLDLRSRRLREVEKSGLSFHDLVAVTALVVLSATVVVSFGVERSQSLLLEIPSLSWFGFATVLALMVACLWDKQARYAVVGIYLLGLSGAAMGLHYLDLEPNRLAWAATIFLAVYSVVAAIVWRSRKQVIKYIEQFGVPSRIAPEATQLNWLSAVTILGAATVAGLAYWIDLNFLEFDLRSSAALAVLAQFLAFGLLAEGPSDQHWRRGAIGAVIVGATLLGWSFLTPGVNATWLNRSVILMLEAFGLTALYGLLLNKANAFRPAWTNAARTCVPWLLGAGVIALFFCLGTEIFYQVSFGVVRIHPVSLLAVGLTLGAAVVICVLFALSPGHDPLSLSERGRMRYVYAAEVMLALLFVHIRLTLPWLFTGFIERYWPLAVMVIAYLGVVTSESLRRRKLLVLAQPLERTGVFLPLLPVLGFWLASSEVDFSALLFVIGGLYGLVSILRRSFVFGVLAAVAGNAGLWYVLQRTADYQFLQHPQLWLIPVALSVLLAAYLNEENLTEDQMAGIRYLSLVTIYASSTADIFINGVANSPWLPLILGSFSLAGVFAGIVFRIRGLLLLGSVFLLLSIITMIWYASANLGWTWLWYVAGIMTGATIIFMFAVFEKKRGEVLRVVEGLKEWER